MKVYNDMAQVVEPKKVLVADAKMSLEAEQNKLKLVEEQLAAVIEKVDQLQATCDATMVEKKKLQDAADTTARRLITADKLTSGLAEEAVRWTETAGLGASERSALRDPYVIIWKIGCFVSTNTTKIFSPVDI